MRAPVWVKIRSSGCGRANCCRKKSKVALEAAHRQARETAAQGRAELQPLGGQIVRPLSGGNPTQPRVLEPDLLAQQRDLLFELIHRQDFVEASKLRVGEKVRTRLEEVAAITNIKPRPPTEWVYNLEVQGEHVYEVGEGGILVHNTCAGLHHYVPMFMGSMVKRGSLFGVNILTWFEQIGHIGIHRALNRHLASLGMARGNMSRVLYRATFSKAQRLRALVRFYRQYQGGDIIRRFDGSSLQL